MPVVESFCYILPDFALSFDSRVMCLFLGLFQHLLDNLDAIEHAYDRLAQILQRCLVVQIRHKSVRFVIGLDIVEQLRHLAIVSLSIRQERVPDILFWDFIQLADFNDVS